MSLSILVPFRAVDEQRIRVWSRVESHWREGLPEAEIVVRDAGGERFHKAASFNRAAKDASGDTFIMADADCLVDTDAVRASVSSHAAVPFARICRVGRKATEEVLTTGRMPVEADGKMVGARIPMVMVLPRKQYFEIGGLDERFIGWGGEDNAFMYALSTMLGAPRWRPDGTAFHLWHPQQEKRGENAAIFEHYRAARGNRKVMAALLRTHAIPDDREAGP